jgi:hypothetical protein
MDELTNFAATFYAVDRGEERGHNEFQKMEQGRARTSAACVPKWNGSHFQTDRNCQRRCRILPATSLWGVSERCQQRYFGLKIKRFQRQDLELQ